MADTAFPAAEPFAERTREQRNRLYVRAWLYVVLVVLFALFIVGGATRLTGSGLSITEWKPIHGVIPPLGEAQWQEEFEKYRQIPQYQLVNKGMSLGEFQTIFWWEWAHRLFARAVGGKGLAQRAADALRASGDDDEAEAAHSAASASLSGSSGLSPLARNAPPHLVSHQPYCSGQASKLPLRPKCSAACSAQNGLNNICRAMKIRSARSSCRTLSAKSKLRIIPTAPVAMPASWRMRSAKGT